MRKPSSIIITLLFLIVVFFSIPLLLAESDRPILVCTTNAVGSVVKEYLGDDSEVVVLVQPSLCPADFDMKPSDIFAVNKALILFKQDIPGEFWLHGLVEAAENPNLFEVIIPGTYNTPEGARYYIKCVGGNLSKILNIDLNAKISSMLAEVDKVANWMESRAQTLPASSIKVICMKWLKGFVESLGFQVVATFDPPETLSAGDIALLIETAQSEGVALVVDNLQIDVEFGKGLAAQVGAEHVVLTNFPGAIPGTNNLTQMFRYNAEQLFNATNTWRSTATLRAELDDLTNEVSIYQITTCLALVIVAVETVWLYMERKRK